MGRFSLQQLAGRLACLEGAVIALWIGLAVLSIILFVLSHTRWGQQHLLRKCLTLSILAHALMMAYASTVKFDSQLPPGAPEPVVQVFLEDGQILETVLDQPRPEDPAPAAGRSDEAHPEIQPLEIPSPDLAEKADSAGHGQAEDLGTPPIPPIDDVAKVATVLPDPEPLPEAPPQQPAPLQEAAPVDAPSQPEMVATSDSSKLKPNDSADMPAADDAQYTARQEAAGDPFGPSLAGLQPPPLQTAPLPTASPGLSDWVENGPPAGAIEPPVLGPPVLGPPVLGPVQREVAAKPVPRVYQLRTAANRSEIAKRYGASNDSEAAVDAALKWLADNQEPDGRWDPARHGAGKELRILGRDRFGAGSDAETGISALALLAFLASGHTHQEGLYRDNVRRGLEFLLQSQASDGNLGGRARTYAFMYCHGMATFALSEAYGMTADRRLESAVRRAVIYTITAQNPTTGGWRYHPGDEGDTSQLGWQLMALKSAELAGIPMPAHTRQGAIRYLESVSSGRFGGLAAYRPVELPSRPMTAEALACRHFLGVTADPRTTHEAAQYILASVPGEGDANFYYWYYATLGLYQTQNDAWDQWNAALQRELLSRQQHSGELAGSWDPNTVWGGYGGRVYTTALATLCLEIYYRFMPLYVEAAATSRTLR